MTDTKLAVVTDNSWTTLIDQLYEQVTSDKNLDWGGLPSKILEATELLLSGHSLHDTSIKLDTTPQTIRSWMSKYPAMAIILSQGPQLLSKWRLSKLEQQFLTAVNKSYDILNLSLDGKTNDGVEVDPKVLTVVAAQSRYIIGLFAGQQKDVTVRHEFGDTILKAKQDALDYLADKLQQQRGNAISGEEPLTIEYRIIDERNEIGGPILDESGNPFFGMFGQVDKDVDGIQCSICGKRFKNIKSHIPKHNISLKDYQITFLLDDGALDNE